MNTLSIEPHGDLAQDAQRGWHRFLDVYEPLRSELFRYCQSLTRSPWDADDLVQDTLARAFVTLACMPREPPSPRAWLFRVASNLWIDRVRRAREIPGDVPEGASSSEPRAPREAAGTLIGRLSPQERAAVVLKDVFDFTLEEVAEALATTTGAVKAALHRGRGKLLETEEPPHGGAASSPTPRAPAEPEAHAPGSPPRAVLDAFCDAFNARDVDRLTALLTDTASVEVVRVHTEYGAAAARVTVFQGMLYGSRRMAGVEPVGALDPSLRHGVLPEVPRAEVRVHRGEPILLLWYAHTDGEAVRGLNRFETDGDWIIRLRNYFFTPDVITAVCGELGVRCRVNGYRYW